MTPEEIFVASLDDAVTGIFSWLTATTNFMINNFIFAWLIGIILMVTGIKLLFDIFTNIKKKKLRNEEGGYF